MLLLGGAFTALLLLISGASAVIVPPPTNVTVTCRNTNVTVSWDYGRHHPETRFMVNISGSSSEKVKETTQHHLDLSRSVWESDECFMDQMSVSVTAVRGGNRSEEGKSKVFTFNNLIPAQLECELDFPPVDLDLKGSRGIVTFRNPVSHSRELTGLQDCVTMFSVTMAGKTVERKCRQDTEVCELDFSYPDGVKDKCVNVTGFLQVSRRHINFTSLENVCPSSAEPYLVTLIVVLTAAGILIVMVTVLVCMTKAWTLKHTPLPEFLEDCDENHKQQIAPVSRTPTSYVTVCNPRTVPSVSSEDDSEDDSADDSEKTECVSLHVEEEDEEDEEEEEETRVYDCRHVMQVDLGDGDMATGYTERNGRLGDDLN